MRSQFRNRLKAMLFVLALAGCQATPTPTEIRTVTEMTTHMRTHGLGRYLIDLPPSWQYSSGEVTLYYGVDDHHKKVDVTVLDTGVTPDRFHRAVAERTKRIGLQRHAYRKVPVLEHVQTLSSPKDESKAYIDQRIALRFYEGIGSKVRIHELHLLLNDGTYVLIKAESYREVPDPYDLSPETEADVEARLERLSRQIRTIPSNISPKSIGYGFILGPILLLSDHDHEFAEIRFFDDVRRNIEFRTSSSAITPDSEETVFSRFEQIKPAFSWGKDGLNVLRRDTRQAGGMAAQEMLVAGQEEGVHKQLFRLTTYRPDPGLMRPTIDLTLDAGGSDRPTHIPPDPTGLIGNLPSVASSNSIYDVPETEPLPSRLTDYEATQVWDAIIKSLRPRPGAATRPPPPPLSGPSAAELEERRRFWDEYWKSSPPDVPDRRPG